jgi:hypothetical protein
MAFEVMFSEESESKFLRNYWVFRFCPSGIPKARKHDISGTGSVSVLR